MHKMTKYRNISAFDLDHTLLTVNSSFKFGQYLYQQRVINFSSMLHLVSCYAAHKAGILSIPTLHNKIFSRLFLGLSTNLIQAHAKTFFDLNFENLLYVPAYESLQKAIKDNHYAIILSSSPSFLVEVAANKLGVPNWKASIYANDKENRFSHISYLIQGENKAHHIKNLCDQLEVPKEKVTAYSDSIHDLPFLLSAGRPIGVRPDKKLRAYCLKSQWTII